MTRDIIDLKPPKPPEYRRAEHVVQGKRYRGVFHIGTGRCVSLKVWVKAGLGHWRQAEITGPKGKAASDFLRDHGKDWVTGK